MIIGRKFLYLQKSREKMEADLENIINEYRRLGIDQQIDYDKFYLYSLITHSTAMEGSTITEVENQIMFDQGVSIKGKSIEEQNMNLDLKAAYERSIEYARAHTPITTDMLMELSSLVMKNTGKDYKTALGEFSSAKGQLRLLNVTAGSGGKSYMNYSKVPARLAEFCERINDARQNCKNKELNQLYSISFDAHFNLATIHPWADGNGRMARLLMNQLQFEFGLIPSIILKEDKEDYIKSLIAARESDDLNIFRDFMFSTTAKVLRRDIDNYLQSTGLLEEESPSYSVRAGKKPKSREMILNMLSKDGSLTSASLAKRLGISPKAVEKHIANLKASGLLRRIGPDKGGHWEVNEIAQKRRLERRLSDLDGSTFST